MEKYEAVSPEILRAGAHGSKATIAFLIYAVRQEENGTGELQGPSFRAVGSSQPPH